MWRQEELLQGTYPHMERNGIEFLFQAKSGRLNTEKKKILFWPRIEQRQDQSCQQPWDSDCTVLGPCHCASPTPVLTPASLLFPQSPCALWNSCLFSWLMGMVKTQLGLSLCWHLSTVQWECKITNNLLMTFLYFTGLSQLRPFATGIMDWEGFRNFSVLVAGRRSEGGFYLWNASCTGWLTLTQNLNKTWILVV